MDPRENSTASAARLHLRTQGAAQSHGADSGGDAHLYILIVMSFYGVFLCAILLGYFQSKRRDKRRNNVFTRLVHEEQQREWGALPRTHALITFPVPTAGGHDGSALCTDGSPPCGSADTRVPIEEESDGSEEVAREESDDSG